MTTLQDRIKYWVSKRKQHLEFGIFNKPRTYFNLQIKTTKINSPIKIKKALKKLGYNIVDYVQGTAEKGDSRLIGIGKILSRAKHFDLKKIFDERLKGDKKTYRAYRVVFTHNPMDIATMSSNRRWTSCMDVFGSDRERVKQIFNKIAQGGMVVYLVDEKDTDIKNPYARISIRKYVGKDGYMFLPAETCYGVQNKTFMKFVYDKIKESNKQTCGLNLHSGYIDAEKGYIDNFPYRISMNYIMEHFKQLNDIDIQYFKEIIIESGDTKSINWLVANYSDFNRNELNCLIDNYMKMGYKEVLLLLDSLLLVHKFDLEKFIRYFIKLDDIKVFKRFVKKLGYINKKQKSIINKYLDKYSLDIDLIGS